MEKISFGEFQDRTAAIIKARRIFIPHFTRSITIAFELYQEILAEQERDRFLTTVTGGRTPMTWMDQFERPSCPFCKEPLYLRTINIPKGIQNKKGWKTCWECLGPICIHEEYSKKSVNEWLKRLKRRKEDA